VGAVIGGYSGWIHLFGRWQRVLQAPTRREAERLLAEYARTHACLTEAQEVVSDLWEDRPQYNPVKSAPKRPASGWWLKGHRVPDFGWGEERDG
jgi:hypothetical protein